MTRSARSDDELVARVRAGHRRALAALLERHLTPLRSFAALVAPRPDLADDIAQESVLRALDALADYRGPERFGAWLRGIARNVAREQWRALARTPTIGERAEDALAAFTAQEAERFAAEDRGAELAALRHCLAEVELPARRLLELRFRLGLGSAAIAETLGRRPGSVRSALSRLYHRLQRCVRSRIRAAGDLT